MMGFDDPLTNRQSQAGAFLGMGSRRIRAIEAIENSDLFISRYSDAMIGDRYPGHPLLFGQGQINLTGQLRQLLKDDYQETMSLECEFVAPGMTHEATSRRSLEGLLKVMQAAVAK